MQTTRFLEGKKAETTSFERKEAEKMSSNRVVGSLYAPPAFQAAVYAKENNYCTARIWLICMCTAGILFCSLILFAGLYSSSGGFIHNGTTMTFIKAVCAILYFVFTLAAAIGRNRLMLKICYWFTFIEIGVGIVIFFLSVLLVTNVIPTAKRTPNPTHALSVIAVKFITILIIEVALFFLIKGTINAMEYDRTSPSSTPIDWSRRSTEKGQQGIDNPVATTTITVQTA